MLLAFTRAFTLLAVVFNLAVGTAPSPPPGSVSCTPGLLATGELMGHCANASNVPVAKLLEWANMYQNKHCKKVEGSDPGSDVTEPEHFCAPGCPPYTLFDGALHAPPLPHHHHSPMPDAALRHRPRPRPRRLAPQGRATTRATRKLAHATA